MAGPEQGTLPSPPEKEGRKSRSGRWLGSRSRQRRGQLRLPGPAPSAYGQQGLSMTNMTSMP